MYGGLCDLQLRERLPQPADDLLTHHILRGEVSCIDEIQPLRIQKVIVPQVGCHKGVAALSDGLRDVFPTRSAAHGHPVNGPAAVSVSQSIAT